MEEVGDNVSAPSIRGGDVHVREVSKTFGEGEQAVTAVQDVSMHIPAGSFVSVIGPSGCGKTTTARMIGDLIAPSSGSILIDGESPGVARSHHRLGFVFQHATLVEWRSVLGNVSLPLDVLRWPREKKFERSRELLRLVGLSEFENHRPGQISGGMQQRVAIARSLSFDPDVLIMDEPFGALDMITRDRMGLELLRIWERTSKTVIFVTHSIEEAVLLSDTVVAMSPRPGRIADSVDIGIPRETRWNARKTNDFVQYTSHLRDLLEPSAE